MYTSCVTQPFYSWIFIQEKWQPKSIQKDFYTNIHSRLISNSQKLEPKHLPTGEWINKYIHTTGSCSAIKKMNYPYMEQHNLKISGQVKEAW